MGNAIAAGLLVGGPNGLHHMRESVASSFARIDLHWHDLRHEAACRWLSAGLDLWAIQLLLGHADLKTTQRYLNVTDAELLKLMREKLWKDDLAPSPPNCQQIVSKRA